MLVRLALLLSLLAVAVATTVGELRAQAVNPFAERHVEATLIPELEVATPGQPLWVALHFEIDAGWHTYWKNPGDSGEPTRMAWTMPDGVEASGIYWPFPHRIPYGPLVNFGYDDAVTHLVRIDVPETWVVGTPLDLAVQATWLVCEDICIPEEQAFTLSIPTGDVARADPAAAALFAETRRQVPVPSPWDSQFAVDGDRVALGVEIGTAVEQVENAVFFPDAWGFVEPAGDQDVAIDDGSLTLSLVRGELVPETSLDGVLVLTERTADGDIVRAVTIAAMPGDQGAAVPVSGGMTTGLANGTGGGIPGTAASIGVLEAMLLALLGGIILNLMPCVFPVLSIKAIGLINHAGGGRRPWVGGLAYTAGVLTFMAALAGVLIALRATGAEIGWGFQLQSPVFVGVMALVLFGLGLALSGAVQIGGSIGGFGSSLAGRGGLAGDAATGALAALVATPCTAPFMGVAIGFALTQPWFVALLVMIALGFGLALPYLLLTLVPGLGRRLPKPGPWMERLKQFLAFPLYASAAWLVWVLSIQGGPSAVLAVLIAMVLIAFALWLHGVACTAEASSWRLVSRGGSVAALVAALLVVAAAPMTATTNAQSSPSVVAEQEGLIERFSPERLTALRAEGRPVFVNMTAAWCITCKVNEQVALKAARVAEAFEAANVAWLEGDWTNRDPIITRYLESFGRSGVPLYVFYPAGDGDPVILPQILTEEGMIAAVAAATGSSRAEAVTSLQSDSRTMAVQ